MNSIEPKPGCIQSAIDILGSKWTALIIRDIAGGPKRFCEIERSIPTLNPRTLSKRLQDLEQHGIIKHTELSSSYALTSKGRDLLPILRKMAEWGDKYPRDQHPTIA